MTYQIVEINELVQSERNSIWQNVGKKEQFYINPNRAIGVSFPFKAPGVFSKTFSTIEQARSNFMSLILTSKGERYYQPDFGTDLIQVIFEPNVSNLKDFIVETITEAVDYWLPYLSITEFIIVTAEDDPNMLHNIKISLKFTVTGIDSEEEITIFADDKGVTTEASNTDN